MTGGHRSILKNGFAYLGSKKVQQARRRVAKRSVPPGGQQLDFIGVGRKYGEIENTIKKGLG